MTRRRFGAVVAAIAMVASLLTVGAVSTSSQPAEAAVASQFSPGNIISDAVQFNGSAMTAAQVQSFLLSQVPVCHSSYACLMNYAQTTPTMQADAYCAAYSGASNELASTIIAKVGAACNINQKSLIVLLEKEQSLVSSDTPTAGRFASATGFGCPDTAPCNSSYGSFFYQVYYAAHQFQIYRQRPTLFNYQAGAFNNILYSPNTACGSSSVFVQNAATAGLYDYTPYQPNAAALANLYGTGDGCSSYGNRNFWRIFTDWFGSPTLGSSLVRTVDNATVYLVSGTFKYPVPSLTILGALSPLGQVAYVSQSYLDGLATEHVVGRSLRSPDGTIYFYDSGIKLAFTNCAQAVDYGASCLSSGYVQLTQDQIDAFYTGPTLLPVLATTAGSKYYITQGTKREILDNASQVAAGIPLGYNVLTEDAVSALPVGVPVVRDSVFAQIRGTSSYSFLSGGSTYAVSSAGATAAGLPAAAAGSLNATSLAKLPAASTQFTGLVQATGSQATEVLVPGGRFEIAPGAGGASALPTTPASAAFVNSYPLLGTLAPGSLIKTAASATVYVVMPTDILPIGSWDALIDLTPPGKSPVIVTVPDSLVNVLPKGPVALESGTLVRSPTNATVYLINGVTNKIPLSSFTYPTEAGMTTFSVTTAARLAAYPTSTSLLGFGLSCGTTNYVSAGGAVHPVSSTVAPDYPFSYLPLDPFTCQNLHVGAAATMFIRTADGAIYYLAGGQKHHVVTMARFAQLSAGQTWLNVADAFATVIPTGADA